MESLKFYKNIFSKWSRPYQAILGLLPETNTYCFGLADVDADTAAVAYIDAIYLHFQRILYMGGCGHVKTMP